MEKWILMINSENKGLKIVMTIYIYEYGKLIRMRGLVIPRMKEFAGVVETRITYVRL